MARVDIRNVSRRYGDVVAVDDVTLAIEDKEFLVLVGPSGSGKSTLLRLIAGLERVSAGELYIGDRMVNDVAPKDRNISMVFQSYALYPHMSVFDNMAFSLTLGKTPDDEIRQRVEQAARILGIEDLLDRKPKQLSGGQRQRVALGRAIVRDPAVFLLDEPLSNLDAKLRVQTRAEISKLHHRLGTTFIYVTHDQVEAMTMAQRIAVLDQGRLQQVGAPQHLYDNPLNVFVAGFIGSPAMNFWEARLEASQGGHRIATDGFAVRAPEAQAKALSDHGDRDIIFGLRPENIHDPEFVPQDVEGDTVTADVTVTELMGNEVFVHLELAGKEFLARVDPRTTAKPGEPMEVAFDMSRMHAFDAETKEALLKRPEPLR
jgi:multiple sugar transport system ATP-binding protein